MPTEPFRDAARAQQSLLSSVEKRVLVWLAHRTPPRINPDHLTALGLGALIATGFSFWYSGRDKLGLLLVIFFLAVNWLGDSLDGTLARVRQKQRPRYGFYVDHIVDALGTTCLLGGLALSGYMNDRLALGLLIGYFLLSIEVYLATYAIGTFYLSFWKFSPTELRILLSLGALVAYLDPGVVPGTRSYRAFDIGGVIGLAAMLIMLFTSVVRHTIYLYRLERVE
ncbi:MAG: CDP-alcohol phosphatidyltransferase family protein [Bryobacteraceae bacterium]|nr:CDP-alcohol phosphatidyltransferase family protein [Bryobacteraceae bacterium]